VTDSVRASGLLSAAEAADRLGISARAVYRLLATGALPGMRSGRRWYVAPADIDRLQRHNPAHATPNWDDLFRQAAFGVAIIDPANGHMIAVNEAFAAMHGRAPDELVGTPGIATVAPEAHALFAAQVELANERGHTVYEAPHLHRDGTRFPTVADVTAVKDGDGRVLYRLVYLQDSSERRTVQTELFENRERLLRVLETIADALLVFDRDGRLLLSNAAAESIYGAERASFANARFDTPPATLLTVAGEPLPLDCYPFAQVRAARAAVRGIEFVVLRADGSRADVVANGAPLLAVDGGFAGAVITIADVTERREAAAALQASEQLYRDLFEDANDLVYTLDLDGHLTALNRKGEEIIGYSREEMLGRSIDPLIIDPERDTVHGMLGRKLAGERRTIYELTLRRKDGRPVRVEISSRLMYRNGQPIGIHGIGRDVTERALRDRAERFLGEASGLLASSLDYEATLASVARLAVPVLADLVLVDLADEQGVLRRVALELAGASEDDAVRRGVRPRGMLELEPGHGVRRVFDSGRTLALVDLAAVAAFAPDPEAARQLRALVEAGVRSVLLVPLIAHGRTLGVITLCGAGDRALYNQDDVALAEELAHRAALAIDNARLYRQAQEAIAVRDQFLSIASHELRTPLTTLRGQVEISRRRLVRGELSAERLERALDLMNGQIDRLGRLVGEMLDVSRLASGQFSVSIQPFSLLELIQRVIEGEQALEPERLLALDAPDGDVRLHADPLRLEQVFVNLIGNARKYSAPQRPIALTLRRESGGVAVVVRDTGPGIAPEDQAHLFEPFWRAASVEGAVSGMGLGLYISREIARAHGGTLTATSTLGEGSTFTLALPRDTVAPESMQ
jgi:PAS domain S-box-containing protein/excisionase family DNA binding protein